MTLKILPHQLPCLYRALNLTTEKTLARDSLDQQLPNGTLESHRRPYFAVIGLILRKRKKMLSV